MDCSEPGVGKSRIAILTILERMRRGVVSKALIVCPKSLLWTWRDEIWKHGRRKSTVITGTQREKLHALGRNSRLFITNYESTIIKPVFQGIRDLKSDMMVFDESSYLKNSQSKRSQTCYIIGGNVKFKMLLSGTPITDSILDIYSQYKVLDGGKTFGTNYYRFFRWCYRPVMQYIPGRTVFLLGGYWMQKSGVIDAIQHKLKGTAISFRKAQCLDLPDKVFTKRYAEWVRGSEQYKDYVEIDEEIVRELVKKIGKDPLDMSLDDILKVNIAIPLAKMNKLQQICGGFVYSSERDRQEYVYSTNPKLGALCEILREYLPSGKIIVFSQFVFDKDLIFSTPFKKYMTDNVDEFVRGPKRIFVSSQVASGMGLNLQVANTMIYYNNVWGIEKRVQSQDRIHRIGQNKKCVYIDLMMKNSIDEVVLAKLESKWDRLEMILRYIQRCHIN